MVKPAYQAPIDKKTYDSVVSILESNLKILHPFMPFLTEEIWQILEKRTPGQALIVASWPEIKPYDHSILESFEFTAEVVSGIRTVRKEKNIPFKNPIDLLVLNNESQAKDFDSLISKLGNITSLSYTTSPVDNALSFRVKSNEYFIPANDAIDIDAEILKIEHELKYTEGFLKSVQKKLSNKRFVLGAPEKVVSSEKKKEMDAVAKIETLKASLINLK
jgi:valyl-tRNA synthetase